jgi:predicted phosphodiesterase
MTTHLRLAITADLHWGVRPAGDEATRLLLDLLRQEPPDLLILAGDVGAGDDFARCLALFDDLACRKALVPGNHDIWVQEDDPRGDSLQVYRETLPTISTTHGFHYLDRGPLLMPEAGLAVAGSMNWYDYSWSLHALKERLPDWEERLRTKRFERGRHNDARFVRWPLDDEHFTQDVVGTLEQHLQQTQELADKTIVVTHHPAFYGLSFPRPWPFVTTDGLLWDAFSGNSACEALLARHAERIPFVFSGHTHRARDNTLGKIRGYNIGGDYHFKRLLTLDWPAGTIIEHIFGNPRP